MCETPYGEITAIRGFVFGDLCMAGTEKEIDIRVPLLFDQK